MRPLDARPQRELDLLRSQPSAWVNLGLRRRLVWAGLVVVVPALVVGGFTVLVDGPGLLIGLLLAGGSAVLVLPNALFPEWALRQALRAVPSEQSTTRSERLRQSWPG